MNNRCTEQDTGDTLKLRKRLKQSLIFISTETIFNIQYNIYILYVFSGSNKPNGYFGGGGQGFGAGGGGGGNGGGAIDTGGNGASGLVYIEWD